MNPFSSMPASSVSSSFGSAFGSVTGSGLFRSDSSIELIISLNSLNLSAGILRPFFVGPV